MKKTTKKKAVKKQDGYLATAIVMGRMTSATGDTAYAAIENLPLKNVKGKCILIVEGNGVKKERVLMPVVTTRLFNTLGVTRQVALKNASLLFL